MKAMVLAAGLGTRLRPLTNDRPKALVEVSRRTMLEIALERLRGFDVTDVIVNTHHHAEMIAEYLAVNKNFGMRVEISREEELLDTGGGLKKAAWFFLESSAEDPFLVHNVDVMSAIDLTAMIEAHLASRALATIAVQRRESSRQLLFDEQGRLCGRYKGKNSAPEMVREVTNTQPLAFCGIHVISPRIFGLMTETGAFSVIDLYVRLAAEGEKVVAFRADGAYWRDLGRPESVDAAAGELRASS